MAGGRGTRAGSVEKAMLAVGGRRLLEIVSVALELAGAPWVMVATTEETPETEAFAKELNLRIIRSPGEGYVEDVAWLSRKLGRFISVAADLPFISSDEFSDFQTEANTSKGSLTGVVLSGDIPVDLPVGPLWHSMESEGHECHAVGINVVDPGDLPDGREFVFKDPLMAVNINTMSDLKWADDHCSDLITILKSPYSSF